MKIAFDLRRMGNPGIGRYMKCLVESVLRHGAGHEYLLLLPENGPEVLRPALETIAQVVPRSKYYSVREQLELPRILREHKIDLLHSPHFLLPLWSTCPSVVTIHDAIYIACPQDLQSRFGRIYYKAMMQSSARRARTIITDSVFSKNEIVRWLRVDPEKVRVIYPAVDTAFRRVCDPRTRDSIYFRHGIAGNYIFYTGIYKPRKNHAGLLRAFRHFLTAGGDGQLVIAGPLDEGVPHLRSLANELGIREKVVLTGFIDDSELRGLYSYARVYACPSLYEGFGFTVLEAMACGTPVVCSQAASLPEVGGEAALYADATNPQAFGEALFRAFADENLREEMIQSGYRNIRRFSWEDAASNCLEIYEKVIGSRADREVAYI